MSMKYFKNAHDTVFAFESDGSQDQFISPDLISITGNQADALRAPVITDEAFNAIVDAQLAAADLKIIRAITEGDTARIDTHKAAQAALRATRK